MNWFSSAARMGTVLPLALFFFVSVPVVTSPCYGQTGTLPKGNAQGINDNYDALKEAIDRTEQSLKDAIADGDTQKANAMRRNLRFYAKRLLNWRTWRPVSKKGPRTARWSRRYPSSKTELLASWTATRSRCDRGPRRAEPSIAQARSPARTARSVIPIPRSWRLWSRTANGWPGEPGASTSDASHPSPKPQTTVKVRPRVALKPVPPMSNSHVVGLSLRMGSACAGSVKSSPLCSTQLAQGCQILDVVEAGTRVILLAEDDVVGKADPEEVTFTQVEIEPQDDGVVVRRPVGRDRGVGFRIEPAFPDHPLAVVPSTQLNTTPSVFLSLSRPCSCRSSPPC